MYPDPFYLSPAIEYYLTYQYHLEAKTHQIYREHLTRLAETIGNKPLAEISPTELCAFMSGLRRHDRKPYSQNYLDQIWRTFNTFFKFYHTENVIPSNPMGRVPRPGQEIGTRPRLSLRQIETLITTIKATDTRRFNLVRRNLAVLFLMVDSGLRLNEVVNLKLKDIDIDGRLAYVYDRKKRKNRDVPLGPLTTAAIDDYLEDRPPAKSINDSLFLTAHGKPLSGKAIHTLMKRLQQRTGIPLHAHLLRHTFANHYIRKGELRKLQKILGHSRIDITARFYTDPEIPDIQSEHEQASPLAQIEAKKDSPK